MRTETKRKEKRASDFNRGVLMSYLHNELRQRFRESVEKFHLSTFGVIGA